MTLRLSRREFGLCCGAGATGLIVPGLGGAQEITFSGKHKGFNPCLDVDPALIPDAVRDFDEEYTKEQLPVRSTPNDPLTATDLELIERDEFDKGASSALAREISDAPAMASNAVRSAAPIGRDEAIAAGLPGRGPARLAFQTKWPTGSKLKVYFYGRPSVARVNAILDIANTWAEFGKIEFTSHSDRRTANLRCGFANTGHWSYIGTVNDEQGGQTMNLQLGTTVPTPGEYNYGVILHEFGHALGAVHEHQQPNADELFNPGEVRKYFKQKYGWSEAKTDLNVLKRYQGTKLLRFSEFDINSIMLYSYPARLTQNGKGTPVNSKLSTIDKQYFARIYDGPTIITPDDPDTPTPVTTTKPLVLDGDVVEHELTPSAQLNVFNFKIEGDKKVVLRTRGIKGAPWAITKVDFSVFKNGSKKPIEPKKRSTLDLINIVEEHSLDGGEYRVEVQHMYAAGTGKYGLELTTKKN